MPLLAFAAIVSSMAAGSYDLFIEQGATFVEVFTWKDSTGIVKPLTGYIARMQVRASYSANSTLVDASTTNGKIVLGGAAGTITITLPATETTTYTGWPTSGSSLQGTGVWDLELESPTGVVTRLLKGKVTLDPEVTHG